MECADYDGVHGADGGLDYVAMLELVARRIEEVVATALATRRPEDPRKMLAIYCGAVHNDLAPAPDWEAFSFGPGLKERIGGRYLEVDLYVPEFVEASESAKEEPWYQLVVSLASPDRAHLIAWSEGSWIIVFRRGVTGARAPSG
jgi:hypothetical protein